MSSNLMTSESNCVQALRRLDAYVDRQLPSDEQSFVNTHLESCPNCRQEAEMRARLKSRVRAAVQQTAAPPYLAARVRANLPARRHGVLNLRWATTFASAAAVVLLTTFVAYQLGYLRWTRASQASFIASISQKVAGIMAVGLREHVHCSVFRKYPNPPKPLEEVREKLPAAYQPLIPMVAAHVPKEFRIAIAHKCGYADREVIHIGLRSDSRLMSLVITKKRPGDTFTDADLAPVLAGAGAEIYASGVQRFQITALETDEFLAYLVSDLPRDQNVRVMLALSPQLRNFLSGVRA